MSKKNKGFRKLRERRGNKTFRREWKPSTQISLDNMIITLLHKNKDGATQAELSALLPAGSDSKKNVNKALDSMTRGGLLHKTGRNRFRLKTSAPIYEGRLTQHPKGFGFVEILSSQNRAPSINRDLFISPSNMGNALHGDLVLVRMLRIKRDDRGEGVILKTLSKRDNTLCGTILKRDRDVRVVPDDYRIPFVVALDPLDAEATKNGEMVRVRYKRAATPQKVLQGTLLEVLGSQDSVDTQMQLVISKFTLPHEFSSKAQKELGAFDGFSFTPAGREDLRELQHITIDGETAKDFDDAICVSKIKDRFQLTVSIADVSHFVTQDSQLDQEAYQRGTSVYFPGRVIPMLPEKLSNELCSLIPGQDRYTVTATLDFDKNGNRISRSFSRSIIRSKKRFTYTRVRELLSENYQESTVGEDSSFIPQLQLARELAILLRNRRFARGAIDFNLSEPFFSLSEKGEIESIQRAERTIAHQIIEEFMLAANEGVASFLEEKDVTPILRIHEPPNEEKIGEFLKFLTSTGLEIPKMEVHPSWFAAVLKAAKGSRYEYIVNNLLLRSLTQARYSLADTGHFGLASPSYTHFTSPIRRYPDLIIHRQLLREIQQQNNSPSHQHAPESTKDAAEFLSKRERTAVEAERDMNERLQVAYMRDRVGESFSAVVSGVAESNLYIELVELCISGSIPVELLTDDYYIFDAKKFRLFGEMSAKTFQIGDTVEVELVDVNRYKRRLMFKPLST